jgi:hypothetical protein
VKARFKRAACAPGARAAGSAVLSALRGHLSRSSRKRGMSRGLWLSPGCNKGQLRFVLGHGVLGRGIRCVSTSRAAQVCLLACSKPRDRPAAVLRGACTTCSHGPYPACIYVSLRLRGCGCCYDGVCSCRRALAHIIDQRPSECPAAWTQEPAGPFSSGRGGRAACGCWDPLSTHS